MTEDLPAAHTSTTAPTVVRGKEKGGWRKRVASDRGRSRGCEGRECEGRKCEGEGVRGKGVRV